MVAQRVHFLVHGRVQGVNFRNYTKKQASECRVTGWCRNTENEKVEGEAQGEEASIARFMNAVDIGPPHAKVVKLDRESRDLIEGETSFEIRQ